MGVAITQKATDSSLWKQVGCGAVRRLEEVSRVLPYFVTGGIGGGSRRERDVDMRGGGLKSPNAPRTEGNWAVLAGCKVFRPIRLNQRSTRADRGGYSETNAFRRQMLPTYFTVSSLQPRFSKRPHPGTPRKIDFTMMIK